jgi:hypothetical protein
MCAGCNLVMSGFEWESPTHALHLISAGTESWMINRVPSKANNTELCMQKHDNYLVCSRSSVSAPWKKYVFNDILSCQLRYLHLYRSKLKCVLVSYYIPFLTKNNNLWNYYRKCTVHFLSLFCHSFSRTIPDPAIQRLTWSKPPVSVLVIKKILDDTIFDPFRRLLRWLLQVRINTWRETLRCLVGVHHRHATARICQCPNFADSKLESGRS